MDPVDQATWLAALPSVALAIALLFGPGLLVARQFNLDLIAAIGVAPALGLFVLLTSATLVSVAGLAWSWLTGIVVVVLVATLFAAIGRALTTHAHRAEGVTLRQAVAFALAALGAASVACWSFVSGTRAPDALAQMPDAPFHLIAARDLVEARSASPWVSGETLWYVPGSWYPGGLHSVVATVASWTGTEVDVASHAVLLVFTGIVWPVAVIALAWAAVSRSGWLVLGVAAVSVAITFSPLTMMPVGAAWANAASAALLPAAVVPLAVLVQSQEAPRARHVASMAVLAATSVAAAALCQPNAVFGLALIGLPLVGPRLVSWGRAWSMAWVASLVAAAVAWVVLFPPSSLDVPVVGEPDLRRAILLVLKGGDLPLWAGGVVAGLAAVGLLTNLGGVARWGITLSWVTAFVFLMAVTVDTDLPVQRLTWPWYSGQARVAPVFAVPMILAVGCGLTWVQRRLTARAGPSATPVAVGALAILVAAAATSAPTVRDAVRLGYEPSDPAFTYVTADEVAALQELSDVIPPGSVTALDPFRGGMYLGMFGRRTIPVVPFSTTTEEGELLDSSLDRTATDPRVCEAARELEVTHVLTGGSRAKFWSSLEPQAPGIDAVPGADGFTEVGTAGPYVLYSLPEQCRG